MIDRGDGVAVLDDHKFIIRASDKSNFKTCRRAWDLGSKIRQNYEPIQLPQPLEFGSAVHKGAEVLYNPGTWGSNREVIEGLALVAFRDECFRQRDRYLKLSGRDVLDEEQAANFQADLELGNGMLKNYFPWARACDNFRPVFAEVEFEVPIPVPPWLELPKNNFASRKGELWMYCAEHQDFHPVVCQGRIDVIVEAEDGYWLIDHKTTSQMREDALEWFELAEKEALYNWAFQQQLGIKVQGVIYNELYKGVPAPPPMNKTQRKGCWFSVNKQQDTTYELYLDTVRTQDEAAYKAGYYDEMLEYLKHNGNKYFRRTRTHRNQTELTNLGYNLCMEAIDMLADPYIYPNPIKDSCKWCMFRRVCLSMNDGSDVNWMLNELYAKRKEVNNDGPKSTDGTN